MIQLIHCSLSLPRPTKLIIFHGFVLTFCFKSGQSLAYPVLLVMVVNKNNNKLVKIITIIVCQNYVTDLVRTTENYFV